jgi:hypothetical protein
VNGKSHPREHEKVRARDSGGIAGGGCVGSGEERGGTKSRAHIEREAGSGKQATCNTRF